jgi:branched-chain amino acid aminotransferase
LFYLTANIETSLFKGDNNWALLLDDNGYITEGTGDNFYIVKDNGVITPEGRNVLRGISRKYVFDLCDELGLTWKEKNIEPYDVYDADEAFITGTPFCMLPVRTLNQLPIGEKCPGPIFSQLLKKWSENVAINIKEQIKNWDNYSSEIDGPTPYKFK